MTDPAELTGLLLETGFVIAISFVFLQHAYHLQKGTEARTRFLLGWAVLYGGAAALATSETLLPFPVEDVEITVALAVANTAVAVGAGLWAYRTLERRTRFQWSREGRLFYRVPPTIPVVYAVLFLGEVGIHLITLGVSFPGTGASPDSLPGGLLTFVRVADLCFSGAAGIIVAVSAGVYATLRRGPPVESGRASSPTPSETS